MPRDRCSSRRASAGLPWADSMLASCVQRGGLAPQVAEALVDAQGPLQEPPRLGGVALGRLDDGQLVQRGGLAPQVAEALVDAQGPLQEPPRLGGVALVRLDDGQLVQRGGLALQVGGLLIELEGLTIQLHGLFVLPAISEQTGAPKQLVRQGGLISGGIRSSPQRDRPLVPAVAELPEAAVLEEIAEGIDHRRQDRIEGTGLPSVRPGRLHDGQGIVETAVDGLVVPRVVPEVARVEEQEAEEPGRVPLRREVRPTLAVVAQRLVEGAEVPLLVAIEEATALQLTDPLDRPRRARRSRPRRARRPAQPGGRREEADPGRM